MCFSPTGISLPLTGTPVIAINTVSHVVRAVCSPVGWSISVKHCSDSSLRCADPKWCCAALRTGLAKLSPLLIHICFKLFLRARTLISCGVACRCAGNFREVRASVPPKIVDMLIRARTYKSPLTAKWSHASTRWRYIPYSGFFLCELRRLSPALHHCNRSNALCNALR